MLFLQLKSHYDVSLMYTAKWGQISCATTKFTFSPDILDANHWIFPARAVCVMSAMWWPTLRKYLMQTTEFFRLALSVWCKLCAVRKYLHNYEALYCCCESQHIHRLGLRNPAFVHQSSIDDINTFSQFRTLANSIITYFCSVWSFENV
jgi:hypothetical protein